MRARPSLECLEDRSVPSAVLPGFDANSLPRFDDGSSAEAVPLGFTANFFGLTFTSAWVNNNGNITFDGPYGSYTPSGLVGTGRQIIAPFFADVDTRNAGSPVTYGSGTVDGHPAFGVNWVDVDYYRSSPDHTNRNSFQLVLIDRSDTGAGNFDIEFNYDQIQWETGQASGGDASGLGGISAFVGYSNGTGNPGTFFELPGSGVPGSFLDSNHSTGLIYNSLNSTVPGRYIFAARSGTVSIPTATTTTLTTSGSPSTFGQPVTFTATVTPTSGTGTPTGIVQFFDGTTQIGSGTLDATTGQASFTTSGLSVGTHTITARYVSDTPSFGDSSSNMAIQTVVETTRQADLAVTKTVSNPRPNVGDTVAFTVTLSNAGPDTATGVTVGDPLPAGLQFVSATPSEGTYDPATGTWTVGTLAVSQRATLAIAAKVISPTTETDIAEVAHSDQADPDLANNSASTTVTPQQADLAVFKSVSNPTPSVGDTIKYTITLDNGGPDPATGVTVHDTSPAGVTYVSSSASQGTYDSTTGTWTVGGVAVGAPQTLTLTAKVVNAESIVDTATAKGDQFDPYEGNNSETVPIKPGEADLRLVKSVDDPRPNVGETVTFTILLVNSGPAAATGVTVSDPLPAGLQFVSATPSEGTYDPATGTWTVGGVAVGAPQTLTLTAKVVSPARETNTATITHADQVNPDPSNNSNSRSIIPTPRPPAPTVTNLQRFGFHHQPTALVLTFDRPLDPARAQLTSNYRLVALVHGGRRRVPVAIASAVYDPAQNTVTLTPKPHGRPFLPLHRAYELTVVGTVGSGLTAADGTPLAGRGGVPGTDAVRQFRFEVLAGSNRPGAPHKPFDRLPPALAARLRSGSAPGPAVSSASRRPARPARVGLPGDTMEAAATVSEGRLGETTR